MKYPKSPRIKLSPKKWGELTRYVHRRDGKRCVFCGNPRNLTPAHVIRRSQGGDDSPNNVVCACVVSENFREGCHQKFDDYKIPLPEHVKEMLSNEPETFELIDKDLL